MIIGGGMAFILLFFNLNPSFIFVTSCFFTFLISFSSSSFSLPYFLFSDKLVCLSLTRYNVAGGSQQLMEANVAAIAKGRVSIGTASVTFYTCFNHILSYKFHFSRILLEKVIQQLVLKSLQWQTKGGSRYFACIYFYLSIATCVQIILYALPVATSRRQNIVNQA